MEFIHIRLPKEVRNQLKSITASKGVSMQKLVSDLIFAFLEQKEKSA